MIKIPKIGFVSLGCPKNLVDSERLRRSRKLTSSCHVQEEIVTGHVKYVVRLLSLLLSDNQSIVQQIYEVN